MVAWGATSHEQRCSAAHTRCRPGTRLQHSKSHRNSSRGMMTAGALTQMMPSLLLLRAVLVLRLLQVLLLDPSRPSWWQTGPQAHTSSNNQMRQQQQQQQLEHQQQQTEQRGVRGRQRRQGTAASRRRRRPECGRGPGCDCQGAPQEQEAPQLPPQQPSSQQQAPPPPQQRQRQEAARQEKGQGKAVTSPHPRVCSSGVTGVRVAPSRAAEPQCSSIIVQQILQTPRATQRIVAVKRKRASKASRYRVVWAKLWRGPGHTEPPGPPHIPPQQPHESKFIHYTAPDKHRARPTQRQ